jgi:hypothetical protein
MKTGQFAELIGVSRQAVLKAILAGKLPKSAKNKKGVWEIDPELGRVEWGQNTKVAWQKADLSDGDDDDLSDIPDFNESRAKREFHMAALAELDHSERSGTLINAEEVRRSAFKLARQTRDGMLNIADRVAADLAAETDAFKVHARLTKEIREALSALALVADESDLPESVQ